MYNIFNYQIDNKINLQNEFSNYCLKKLDLYGKLEGHEGCINCLDWNYKKDLLGSGSDDCNIILWNPFKKKKLAQFHSTHTGNIFSIKFLQSNYENMLVTGAADFRIILHDYVTHSLIRRCSCHKGQVKKISLIHTKPNLILSAAEDGIVLQTDVRSPHKCNNDPNVFIDLKKHCGIISKITSIAVNPVRDEYVAVGANDPYVRLYDRRMIKLMEVNSLNDNLNNNCVKYYTFGDFFKRDLQQFICSSLTFSQKGDELLANMCNSHVYLYNIIKDKKPITFLSNLTNIFGTLEENLTLNNSLNEDFNNASSSKKQDKLKSSSFEIKLKNSNSQTQNEAEKKIENIEKKEQDENINNNETVVDQKNSDIDDNDSYNDDNDNSDNDHENNNRNINKSKNYKISESSSDLYFESNKLIEKINLTLNANYKIYLNKKSLPKKILQLYNNALSYFLANKYYEAIEIYNEIISKMPNVFFFYTERASVLMKRNWMCDRYSALKDLYKALELNCKNSKTHFLFAQCLLSSGYVEDAFECIKFYKKFHSTKTRSKQFKDLENEIMINLKEKIKHDKDRKNANNQNLLLDDNTIRFSSSLLFEQEIESNEIIENLRSNLAYQDSFSSDEDNESRFRIFTNDSDSSNDDLFETSFKKSDQEIIWRKNSCDFQQLYCGNCNYKTDIMEAKFFGIDDQFIISGSDDGTFFIWDKKTTNILNVLISDEHIVSCVLPYSDTFFLVTSGNDFSIKLWSLFSNEQTIEKWEEHSKHDFKMFAKSNHDKLVRNLYRMMLMTVNYLQDLGELSYTSEDESSML